MHPEKSQFDPPDAPMRQKAYYGRDRRGYDVSLDMRDEEGVPMLAFRQGDSMISAVRADESSSWDRQKDPGGQQWGAEYWDAINRTTQFSKGRGERYGGFR